MIGTEPFKSLFHMFRNALGDLEVVVEKTVVEGDTCAAYCRVKGADTSATRLAQRRPAARWSSTV